jgi:hypothetical protein
VSEIIDKITEGAGQVISEFEKGGQIHSAISGIRQRMAESDRRRKINTIKKEIQDLHTKEAQAINSLSAQVLALYEAGSLSQPELVSLCKGVDEVRDQIREKEAELAQFQPPNNPNRRPGNPSLQLQRAVPVAGSRPLKVLPSARAVAPSWWKPNRLLQSSFACTVAPNCGKVRDSVPSAAKQCLRVQPRPVLGAKLPRAPAAGADLAPRTGPGAISHQKLGYG